MPSVIPNIPCLFYKSWGWALLGGLALVGGSLVMLTGVILVTGRSASLPGPAGALTGLGSRTGTVSRRSLARPLRTQDQTDDDNEELRQQADAPVTTRVYDTDRRYQTREAPF